MREIKYIVIHCTATHQNATIAGIKNHWRNYLGWQNPGYHYIIEPNGNIEPLIQESSIANGVLGYNAHAVHLSYIGGIDSNSKPLDNRTDKQREAMKNLVKELHRKYPDAEILGHRDFWYQYHSPAARKACPSFDVKTWLDEENILNN